MIYNIQYLRFFAAAAVVATHACKSVGSDFPIGNAGVDVFFVISGFIMVFITAEREQSPLRFSLARIKRVGSPYWILTSALAAMLLLFPQKSVFDWHHVLASVLFVPYPHPSAGIIVPVILPGWTLNYEMFFYVVFAVALSINVKRRALIAAGILICFALAGLARGNVAWVFYTDPIPLEFIYGMAIASIFVRGVQLSGATSFTLVVAGACGLVAVGLFYPIGHQTAPERFLVWGLPAALLVAGLVFGEVSYGKTNIPALLFLGEASYSIYLIHFPMLNPMVKAMKMAGLSSPLALASIAFTAAICAGIAFHVAVERTVLGFFSRKRQAVLLTTNRSI